MSIGSTSDNAGGAVGSRVAHDTLSPPQANTRTDRGIDDGFSVIVVAATKGGVGKTTLTLNLAAAAEAAGDGPSAMLDMDPQGSLTHLYNRRGRDGGPVMLARGEGDLAETLAVARRSGIRMVVIDTPPAFLDMIRACVAVADLVVVPARPSPLDLEAVGPTIDIVEAAGKPLVLVVNAAKPRTRLKSDAGRVLAQHGKVAPVDLVDRIVYSEAMIDGLAATEYDPLGPANKEVGQLYEYIERQLRRRPGAATGGPS
ncbi:MAG: ParA family protein [Proteobacteria bacterium]|nr:ParA family protein [Pseudomonadota bacterium]